VGLVNSVGINQKKGRKNGVYLLNHGTAGIRKKMIVRRTLFAAPVPKILYPSPGFVVDIDKILVIEVDFGEIPLGHSVLSPLDKLQPVETTLCTLKSQIYLPGCLIIPSGGQIYHCFLGVFSFFSRIARVPPQGTFGAKPRPQAEY
jgi:hypothetical protein